MTRPEPPAEQRKRGRTVTQALAENGGAGTDVATRSEDTLSAMMAHIEPEIVRQLPKHIPAEYFLRTTLTGLRKSNQLAAVATSPKGRASLYAAMLEAARMGLMPFTKEGAIVVFGQGAKAQAQWIPQWQGLVKVMRNSGQVSAVEARLIHQHDEWDLSYGDGGRFYHRPFLIHPDGSEVTEAERGPAVLAYFYLGLSDGTRTEVTTVTRQQAIEVRDRFSRSYRNAEKSWGNNEPKRDSTWHTDFPAMWIKTAVRQGADKAPQSPMLAQLLLAAARDDLERPPAAEPPTLADMDADGVMDGEVISDSDDAAQGEQEQAAGQGGEPEPRPRGEIMRQVNSLFDDLGLSGPRHRLKRVAICGTMLTGSGYQVPSPYTSLGQLSDAELEQCAGMLLDIHRGSESFGGPTPDADVRRGLDAMAERGGWQAAEGGEGGE